MMPEIVPPRPTYARIDLDNLAFNLHSAREFIGRDVRCMAVVKANAYGHGAVECARRLDKEGVEWFAVATLEEAAELRTAGITKPILCLGGLYPGQEEAAIRLKIRPVVFTLDAAERMDLAARDLAAAASIHVKIDTGMGRVGVPQEQVGEFVDRLRGLRNLEIEGLMTHFAAADDLAQSEFTRLQTERLEHAASLFREHGMWPAFIDAANSPGAVAHPSSRKDMVRLGGILYGLGRDVLPQDAAKPDLRPVLSLHSKLAQVKRVRAGTSIGYGMSFVTTRASVIGTVPIGYHDGYRRQLSNRAQAIVGGTMTPVVGRVSMDWVTLDLTEAAGSDVGDDVVLIGQSGGHRILAEDLAADSGTISYEITCGISARVPRRFGPV